MNLDLINKIYKLLDFFPDNDPLKNKAKEKTLEILEGVAKGQAVSIEIEILKNYLSLGRYQGWIDSINFLIIEKELDGLKEVKSEKSAVIATKQNLGEYTERQKKILEILRNKEKAQVSDFIKELPKVTKRTIRRDLDDLLKKGEVARFGQWNQSSYRLGHTELS